VKPNQFIPSEGFQRGTPGGVGGGDFGSRSLFSFGGTVGTGRGGVAGNLKFLKRSKVKEGIRDLGP